MPCVDMSLVANLARGHYSVTLYIHDNATRKQLIRMRRIASMTVSENRARAGIAHLDMTARLLSSVDEGIGQAAGQR